MKILFIRHGESTDDLENRYGGWADFPLTKSGSEQIKDTIPSIENLNEDFEIVYTSPLQRATQSAEIISQALKIPCKTFEYIKERNTYGILSGMEKKIAAEKYPQQVKNYESGQYVDASERYEDFTQRVKKSVQLLKKQPHQTIIVVTHGKYLKCLFKEILGKRLTKKEDGGFALIDFNNENMNIVSTSGIEYD